MKIRYVVAMMVCFLAAACSSHEHKTHAASAKPTVRLTLLPQDMLTPHKITTIQAKLNTIEARTLVTSDDLEAAHTQKFHLLIIDPTLTDYQHIHPQPTATPGLYSFSFTPNMAGSYRVWADIIPIATHKQEFAMADLGTPKGGMIKKTESHEASIGGYHFTLSFDTPPVADGESMGTIHVTDKKGDPVAILQPVMGAFAHVVGFYDDFRTVVHTHPMGQERQNDTAHGGPELMFHLSPEKAGFVKLFAQVKINGKELVVPFGVNISPAP